jgi:hypothetical protein
MRVIVLFVLAMLAAPNAWAGPKSLYLTNVGHYIKSHKVELFGDFVMVGASAADVETSVRAFRTPGVCETNPLLPCHPSRAQIWGVKMPFLLGLGVSQHYLVKWTNNDPSAFGDEKVDKFSKIFIQTVIPAIWGTGNAVFAHDNAKKIR